MRGWLSVALACVLAAGAVPAEAQKRAKIDDNIDFGSYSCRQFLEEAAEASEDDVAMVLIWLDGYLSGVSGDTVLTWDGFERFAEALVNYCDARGNHRLLDAARRVGLD